MSIFMTQGTGSEYGISI